MIKYHRTAYKTLRGRRFGYEHSTVSHDRTGEKYLERWILYGFGITLRIHKFYRGDDDRASHTHPWWFITFPLKSYLEDVYERGRHVAIREVKAFRLHYRPAQFEHIVKFGVETVQDDMFAHGYWRPYRKPFYTLVLTGNKSNEWGFYPEPDHFIHHRSYL